MTCWLKKATITNLSISYLSIPGRLLFAIPRRNEPPGKQYCQPAVLVKWIREEGVRRQLQSGMFKGVMSLNPSLIQRTGHDPLTNLTLSQEKPTSDMIESQSKSTPIPYML